MEKVGDKGMRSTLLISPVDPEATLRKKANQKHIGYVANIILMKTRVLTNLKATK